MVRHHQLLGQPSDVAPILWQNGVIARLEKGEKIDKYLFNNYSTISLGYVGIAECVWRMKGCSHTTEEGKEFAIRVLKFLNDKCAKWRAETNISFSLYGTPMETTVYKFAKCLKKKFGIIPHVTDRNFITNSYHVHVEEEIPIFDKFSLESKFQELSPGGCIAYGEVPNMQNNIPGVIAIMRHIYDNIMYAELNTKSDYCQVCGFDGEIVAVEDNGKLVWECPNCGNRDTRKINLCRRVCGKDLLAFKESSNVKLPQSTIEIQGKPKFSNETGNLESSLSTPVIDNRMPMALRNVSEKQYPYKCDICGRPMKRKVRAFGITYCNKHYNQIKKYGHAIDDNPRTIFDENDIYIKNGVAYMDLYDKYCNVVATTKFDIEDIPKAKRYKWRYAHGYAHVGNKKITSLMFHRIIIDTDDFVDHINHDTLDNRKANLRVATKSQNAMNMNHRGVRREKSGKWYPHIKINQKMISLGHYEHEEQALYARWYAEQILFKEYAYKKEEPELPEFMKKEIREYVDKKTQRL